MSDTPVFDLKSGYVTMTSAEPVTFEAITKLAYAGVLAGIPPTAEINDLRLAMQNAGPRGVEYRVDISWQISR